MKTKASADRPHPGDASGRQRSGSVSSEIDQPPSSSLLAGLTLNAVAEPPPVEEAISLSAQSAAFRDRFFPEVTDDQWSDWRWQLRARIRTLAELERIFELSSDERRATASIGDRLPVGITPYYASLMDRADPLDPLRLTMIPLPGETEVGESEADDPLAEESHTVVPGLVHRYPDRVLFLVSNFCATYCRYCTRARMVGKTGEYHFNHDQYQEALDYISAHPEIRDVLISGGDPLTMSDDRLEWLFSRIREIPHVEFLRVGSKVPSVLPQRITPALSRLLRRHQVWVSAHFQHVAEVTPEVAEACGRLVDHGVLVGSQTVLVNGVNDSVRAMKELVHALLRIRVRPYYLYQCDPISGSAHLRTPVAKGLEIIAGLRGHTTGYAVPQFVIDAPGGGGKIPLVPEAIVGRDGNDILVRNFEGEVYRYPDPLPEGAN